MKKTAVFLLCLFLMTAAVNIFAQDDKKLGWELDLKRISLNITSTEVKNSEYYQGFSNSKLTADGQTLIQGYMNLTGNYYKPSFLWGNALLTEYGRTKIRPVADEDTKTENVDRILFTTEYSHRMWNVENLLGGFEAGPFANLEYETEFTKQSGAQRREIGRGRLGFKAFEGKYVKNLYAAAVAEVDWTYSPTSERFAWETGFNIEHPIREGVKAQYSGYFRQYFHESKRHATDIKYEMELDARMDVLVWNNLSVAPFINFYMAKAVDFSEKGQNLFVGVSFSFAHTFIKADQAS